MSFSQHVKTELCSVKLNCKNCKFALIYGMLLTSRTCTATAVSIHTENKSVANIFAQTIVELTGAIVTINCPDLRKRKIHPSYTVTVDSGVADVFAVFGGNKFDRRLVKKDCCKAAFLRGAFLTCATVVDPQKEYHLAFLLHDEDLCYTLFEFLEEHELEFSVTTHGKGILLYTKESQQIEDTLTALGAVKASMDLMNCKIEKELRNNVNRRTNCETANISKTVDASIVQIECINRISATIGLDQLPAELKEIAVLRQTYPELSLSELCAILDNKISRSGLNHRLKKICSIANTLGGE